MVRRGFLAAIVGLLVLSKKDSNAASFVEALPSADATNIAAAIHGATAKTPVNADEISLTDSATSFSLKKVTLANLKSFLFSSPTFTGTTTVTTINGTTANITNMNGTLNGNYQGSAGNSNISVCNSNNGIANFAGEALSVRGNGVGAAVIAFHRPGSFAAYLGLDTDNVLKYGGWSQGANAQPVFTKANCVLSGTTLTITI